MIPVSLITTRSGVVVIPDTGQPVNVWFLTLPRIGEQLILTTRTVRVVDVSHIPATDGVQDFPRVTIWVE